MRRIIDAHCHIYPDGISRRAVDAVDRFYDGLPSDHYDGKVETLLRIGRESGVTHFVVHSVATRPEQVRSINQFIARSVKDAEGAFIGMGTMHPDSTDQEHDFRELMDMVHEAVPGAEVHSAKAGCTITSHCGPKTLGVLFLKK